MSRRLEQATELFNYGFNTKADQKRCLDLISREYDANRSTIMNGILDRREDGKPLEGELKDLYYMMPHELHQFRPRHAAALNAMFPAEVAAIESLVEFRNTVKAAPVVPAVKDTAAIERLHRIELTVFDIYAKHLDDFNRGIELAKIFKRLPVSVTPHYVHRNGTHFKRCFYFMAGKLTALNVILAVLDATAEDK